MDFAARIVPFCCTGVRLRMPRFYALATEFSGLYCSIVSNVTYLSQYRLLFFAQPEIQDNGKEGNRYGTRATLNGGSVNFSECLIKL